MLQSLHIRNLALVTELDLELTGGFNVITGETGAGKSLIIGAIQLLAGGRATPALIRNGEKRCEVSAQFDLKTVQPALRSRLEAMLEEAGIEACDEEGLLLRRIISETGSRSFVNGAAVTVNFLRELGELLIDLHGPHDNQSILKNAKQLELLDVYAQSEGLLKRCHDEAAHLNNCRKKLEDLEHEGLQPEQLDLLRHQLKEIRNAELQPGEDEEILRKYKLSENSKRLLQLANQAAEALSQGEHSVVEQVGSMFRLIREIEQHDPEKGAAFDEKLTEIHDGIQELSDDLEEYALSMDLDEEEIQEIENRLELIQKLKRKYGPALQDVLDTAERIKETIEKILGRGDMVKQLRADIESAEKALATTCKELDARRRAAAPPLAEAITEKLKKLGFNKAEFTIELKSAEPGPTGANTVEFMFAPNLGEERKPLKATASSGETARVMLALKTVLSDADAVPVLVFDEIDANVGGRTAGVVADELRAVATKHQVFSITHLAQIAAAGNTHFMVEKHTDETRTTATMRVLSQKERVDELVRMLGADARSVSAKKHALELLGAYQAGDKSVARKKGNTKGNV